MVARELKHSINLFYFYYIISMQAFDSQLRSTLASILNIDLTNDLAWLQASLPIRSGGIGVRSTTMLAPSAFLSSAAGCKILVSALIPAYQPSPLTTLALAEWSDGLCITPPSGGDETRQKSWDKTKIECCQQILLDSASDNRARARLLAASTKESGYWLEALPITSLGLRMDDFVIRIAAGLRLGLPICTPHGCQHCGSAVDELGTHGLSCRKSQGRHTRHGAANNIISHALTSAGAPSRLEPSGLCLSNNSRSDRATLVP